MPFTPFHMGFGLAAKAAAGHRVGLVSFGVAQVLMDIEPGVRMLLDDGRLHGWSHTLPGALLIGALATWGSSRLSGLLVRRWNAEVSHYGLGWLCVPGAVSAKVLAAGAFVGTFSHVALDSLMHADMQPLAPWSSANPLMGLVAHDAVYTGMVVLGVAGGLSWLIRQWLQRHVT